ncbi:MAG: hypothetical protein WA192_02540 [Candidatus Acidiferrales bacterium]
MKLRCPFCRQAFPWEAALPFPRVCPLCTEEIGIPDRGEVIQMPSLRSAKTKAVDKTYRDIEAGSEVRVERAAEVTGTAKEDMAALRITDMADNMRAGDIAAKEADAAMKRLQSSTPMNIGFQANGAEFSNGISTGAVALNGKITTGIEPNAGARAAQRVQRRMQQW